jgi:hypothetical protein
MPNPSETKNLPRARKLSNQEFTAELVRLLPSLTSDQRWILLMAAKSLAKGQHILPEWMVIR